MMDPNEYEKNEREMWAIEGVMWECREDIRKLAKKHGSPSDFELFVAVERVCIVTGEWVDGNRNPEGLRDARARLHKALKGRADALDVADQRAYCMDQALDAWLALPQEFTDSKRKDVSDIDRLDRLMDNLMSKKGARGC